MGKRSNSELFRSIDKLHGRAAKLIYNLGNDTSYEDALKQLRQVAYAVFEQEASGRLMAYHPKIRRPGSFVGRC